MTNASVREREREKHGWVSKNVKRQGKICSQFIEALLIETRVSPFFVGVDFGTGTSICLFRVVPAAVYFCYAVGYLWEAHTNIMPDCLNVKTKFFKLFSRQNFETLAEMPVCIRTRIYTANCSLHSRLIYCCKTRINTHVVTFPLSRNARSQRWTLEFDKVKRSFLVR